MAYAWWALVGALLGIGIASLLTVGLAFLVLGAVLALVGIARPGLRNRSAVALVGGLAVAPLYIGWLNRGGPGRVCHAEGTSVTCVQEWAPWPFVVVGLALVVGCFVAGRSWAGPANR